MIKTFHICIVVLFVSLQANAGTFYIDWVGGNDANNGTAQVSPWKRHPYMNGFTGTYTHSPGDIFIFKGGVTWPAACFQMEVKAGGSSNLTRDQYTADSNWYDGGSFSNAVFDFGHTLIGTYQSGAGVHFNGSDYTVNFISWSFIDLKNHRAPLGAPSFGCCSMLFRGDITGVEVSDCTISDWDQVSAPGAGEDGGGGIYNISGSLTSMLLLNVTMHQAGVSMKTGRAYCASGTVSNCTFHDVCNAVLAAQTVHHSTFYNLKAATDPDSHENAIEAFSPMIVYNNLIYGVDDSAVETLYLGPGTVDGGQDLVFNNVFYGVAKPIEIDCNLTYSTNSGSMIVNNTIVNAGGGVRVVDKGSGSLGWLTVQNNHIITSGYDVCTAPVSGCDSVGTLTVTNNLVQVPAVAAAAGYNAAHAYQPTVFAVGAYSTVDAGLDLSGIGFTSDYSGVARPQSTAWDIGAYEMIPTMTNRAALMSVRVSVGSN